ncbi:AAA family ATPase [Mycoplasmopsis bovigenitalium]|uniref:AAA family ATPase n=1 Tax=Mycoplasmopsis bovigenitalium TaxID=2112 RepID=UPI000BBA91F2|nr:AAA family ATPase [Mycoplasmopsis bovigenitalium]
MNILYDKKKKEYILGDTKFTKDEFVQYIESDMLETVLSNEDISLEMDKRSQDEENKKDMEDVFCTSYNSLIPANRIIFGAPGTGKSYTLNNDLELLLGENNEDEYERVTFHPDYSYANFVGAYKPVMVENSFENLTEITEKDVVSLLTDKSKSAQEKYDLLYDKFKEDGLTRLPLLLGLYTDDNFTTRKVDGSAAIGDNSVERNHGKAIRPYVNLFKPVSRKKDISYEYVPGPFMRVLVKALKNAMTDNPRPFVLLIEEINRANVAAVFGDIFQLLDRDSKGVSEYKIATTNDMRRYLSEQLGVEESNLETIKIPNNMFIWATMNSADQGVFPMDTAFKRRWDFTYLGIDDSDDALRGKYVMLSDKKTQKVEWNKLRKAINKFLSDNKINEDKQLGPYFLSKDIIIPEQGDEINREKFISAFKNKVIMYLFEDAAKQKRSKLFEGCSKDSTRYSQICKEFEQKGVGIFNADIILDCDIEDVEHENDNSNN